MDKKLVVLCVASCICVLVIAVCIGIVLKIQDDTADNPTGDEEVVDATESSEETDEPVDVITDNYLKYLEEEQNWTLVSHEQVDTPTIEIEIDYESEYPAYLQELDAENAVLPTALADIIERTQGEQNYSADIWIDQGTTFTGYMYEKQFKCKLSTTTEWWRFTIGYTADTPEGKADVYIYKRNSTLNEVM